MGYSHKNTWGRYNDPLYLLQQWDKHASFHGLHVHRDDLQVGVGMLIPSEVEGGLVGWWVVGHKKQKEEDIKVGWETQQEEEGG